MNLRENRFGRLTLDWAKTGIHKDLDSHMAFYTDDTVLLIMPSDSPVISGKAAIRAVLERDCNRPDFSVTWRPDINEVAQSGDLRYVIGFSEARMNDDNGKPILMKGKYIEIRKKQKDGSWKCAADIFNRVSVEKQSKVWIKMLTVQPDLTLGRD